MTDNTRVTRALNRTGVGEPPAVCLDGAQLTDVARAFRAAARAVVLYPQGHSAITASLGRLADLTSPKNLSAPMRIGVLADSLLIEGRTPGRADPAIAEMAALLHGHLVGELVIRPGGDPDAWFRFLQLLARSSESIRADGGLARLWSAAGGGHVELRAIDYSEVLREGDSVQSATWDEIIAACLRGECLSTEDTDGALAKFAADLEQLEHLVSALETRARETSRGPAERAAAVATLLQSIVEAVNRHAPETLAATLRNLGTAVAQLSPETIVALLETESHVARSSEPAHSPGVVDAVVGHMSDDDIAAFLARNTVDPGAPIERVAQAFQALVRDSERRERLLTLGHEEAAKLAPDGGNALEEMWDQLAQNLMLSYSDEPFVTAEYARELSNARADAIDLEQVSDDPPERMSGWLATVATNELRKLDLTLVLDLLRVEEHPERWAALMRPVNALLEDLFLVGDFEAAEQLIRAVASQTTPHTPAPRREVAVAAVRALASGQATRHILEHLATLDAQQFSRAIQICTQLGDTLIPALAEALRAEQRPRARERLAQVLVAYGSERAFSVLRDALTKAAESSRDTLMSTLVGGRDGGTVALCVNILKHLDHRGPQGTIYIRAIEALGSFKDPAAVTPLGEALYRGEWWAPRRSARLRAAAASSLGRIGTAEAVGALERAAASGSRGVRAAARFELSRLTRPPVGERS